MPTRFTIPGRAVNAGPLTTRVVNLTLNHASGPDASPQQFAYFSQSIDVAYCKSAPQNVSCCFKPRSPVMSVSKRDTLRHTYADYVVWSRNHGDELIDGHAFVREPPSPSVNHQLIAVELVYQIQSQLEGSSWRVLVAPLDIRLPKTSEPDNDVDTVVQPDVFIVRDINKLDARGMRGAPDWLGEVLSPSTADYDRVVKIPLYERAGVQEVWLIDTMKRSVAIYRLRDGCYGKQTVLSLTGKTPLSAVPGVTVDWDRITARFLNTGE